MTTGRTVDEAKESALDELGVDEHDAEFEILEEPRQGLFGRQRGEARVRARVRPSVPRPKADRRDRRRKRSDAPNARGESETDASVAAADQAADVSDEPPAPARRAAKARGTGGRTARSASDAGATDTAVPVEVVADALAEATPRRRRPRKAAVATAASPAVARRRGGSADDQGDHDDEHDEAGTPANGGTAVAEQELDLTQQAEIAEAFVRGLLEHFALPAETSVVTLDEETFEVQVAGSELGLLIGPKGQTLQSVQELTRTVVQRRASNRTGRILVDVAGYRVRRREALERFTQQVADDVRETGVQRVLEPMSAADRKVVHDTANSLGGVRTISEGEEPYRRVVIIPDSSSSAGDQDVDAG